MAIDFTDTAALQEITEKVSEAIVESNLGTADRLIVLQTVLSLQFQT